MKDVTTEQNSQKVRETHNSYNEIDALQHFYKQIGILPSRLPSGTKEMPKIQPGLH